MLRRHALALVAALVLLAPGLRASDPIDRYKKDDLSKLGEYPTVLVLRLKIVDNSKSDGMGNCWFRYESRPNSDTDHGMPWQWFTKRPGGNPNNADVVLYARAKPGRYDLRGYSFDSGNSYFNLPFHRTIQVPADSLVVGNIEMVITNYDRRRNTFSYDLSFVCDDSLRANLLTDFAAQYPLTAARFKGREAALNNFPLIPWPKEAAVYQRDFTASAGEWPLTDDAGRPVACDSNGYVVSSPDTLRGAGWVQLPVENLGRYYSVELCTRWLSGGNGIYGLVMGKDSTTFQLFGLTSAGEYGVWESWKPLGAKPEFNCLLPRAQFAGIVGKGAADNVMTVEVRDGEVTWFVNGKLVRQYKPVFYAPLARTLGLVVYGPQRVAFKWLRVTKW